MSQREIISRTSLLLPRPDKGLIKRALCRAAAWPLERLIGLGELDRIYQTLPQTKDLDLFLSECMRAYGFSYRISAQCLERIPASGPLMVVCNHPFGGIEGVILAHLLRRVRPDVKLMANGLLARIAELREAFIFVDPFGTREALQSNLGPLKKCLAWLKQGKALGVFPAGEVASLKPIQGKIAEPLWSQSVAKLAVKAGASVLPLYFEGANGPLFHCLGLLHPRLRTLMLARELVNKRGKCVDIRVGNPIAAANLLKFGQNAAAHLRLRTLMLGEQGKKSSFAGLLPLKPSGVSQSVIAAVPGQAMQAEITALGKQACLAGSGNFQVVLAKAADIPLCLREIGRLREITFRKVGEGTGKSCDLDAFDNHYRHLILWDTANQAIAGAYRFCLSDETIAAHGLSGLYTHTLFKFNPGFFTRLGPALELGRSFVALQYQKSYAPLLLLLRGVASFVAANPRYHRLFGPVSISSDYKLISRQLMAAYFEQTNAANPLFSLVSPRMPLPRGRGLRRAAKLLARDLDDLSAILGDIEGKPIPVLLRQYLKLGGVLLGFNLDPDFSYALDGLIMVDLLKTDPRQLAKFMNKPEQQGFYDFHGHNAL